MSSKQEISDNLIKPLMAVFGDFRDGHIEWLLENCQKYSVEKLKIGVERVIRTSDRFPFPAVIINAIEPPSSRMGSVAGG
jgi:hypothetical protein